MTVCVCVFAFLSSFVINLFALSLIFRKRKLTLTGLLSPPFVAVLFFFLFAKKKQKTQYIYIKKKTESVATWIPHFEWIFTFSNRISLLRRLNLILPNQQSAIAFRWFQRWTVRCKSDEIWKWSGKMVVIWMLNVQHQKV